MVAGNGFLDIAESENHNDTKLVANWNSPVPAITLKNIPDDLYIRLKETAKAHRRSLNSEILYCVERTLGANKIDVNEHLAMARSLRAKTANNPLTDTELNLARNEGRP